VLLGKLGVTRQTTDGRRCIHVCKLRKGLMPPQGGAGLAGRTLQQSGPRSELGAQESQATGVGKLRQPGRFRMAGARGR
jgi:hypothetical protein